MEITSKKEASIQLRGKRATLLVNPIDEATMVDAVIVTHDKEYRPSGEATPRLIITGPGEYEIGGISVSGRRVNGQTAFRIMLEGVSLLYLPTIPNDKATLEQFAPIDILLLGDYAEAIYELEPKIIVPFTEAVGAKLGKEVTSEKKLSITKEKLPQDLKVVIIHG